MSGTEVYERLCRRFGKPAADSITERLYQKLASVAEIHGDHALHVISQAAADSVGKGSPDRYFAKVVTCRLREQGILATAEL